MSGLPKDGTSYLAGIGDCRDKCAASLLRELKVFKSSDMKTWTEMAVDYRAVAPARDSCPAPDEQNIWLATDNGMILKLK